MSELRQAFREAVAALAADPAFAPHVGPGAALALWDPWGRLVWTTPEASGIERALVVHPDGSLDPGVPALARLKALARGGAPRTGIRLERLRFDPSRLSQPTTCACRIVAVPSGEEALLTAFVGGAPKLTVLRRAAAAAPPSAPTPLAAPVEPVPSSAPLQEAASEPVPPVEPAPEPQPAREALSEPVRAEEDVREAAPSERDPEHAETSPEEISPDEPSPEGDEPPPSAALFLDDAVEASRETPEEGVPEAAASAGEESADRPELDHLHPERPAQDRLDQDRSEPSRPESEGAETGEEVPRAAEPEGEAPAPETALQEASSDESAAHEARPEEAVPDEVHPGEPGEAQDDAARAPDDRAAPDDEGATAEAVWADEIEGVGYRADAGPRGADAGEPDPGGQRRPTAPASDADPEARPGPEEHAAAEASAAPENDPVESSDPDPPAQLRDGASGEAEAVAPTPSREDRPEAADTPPEAEGEIEAARRTHLAESTDAEPAREPEAGSVEEAAVAAEDPEPEPPVALDEPLSLAPEAPAPEPAPVDPVAHLRGRGTVRFVWQADSQTRFTAVSDALAGVVGPASAALIDKTWSEIAAGPVSDPVGLVSDLLAWRETWSGRTVLWRIDGTDLAVEVDLAGMPALGRDRELLGFRGFGLCRTDRIVPFRRRPPEPPLPPLPEPEPSADAPDEADTRAASDETVARAEDRDGGRPAALGGETGAAEPVGASSDGEPGPSGEPGPGSDESAASSEREPSRDGAAQADSVSETESQASPADEPPSPDPVAPLPGPDPLDAATPTDDPGGIAVEPDEPRAETAPDAPPSPDAAADAAVAAEPEGPSPPADPDEGAASPGDPHLVPIAASGPDAAPETTASPEAQAEPEALAEAEPPRHPETAVPESMAAFLSEARYAARPGSDRTLRDTRRAARRAARREASALSLSAAVPAFLGQPPQVPLREADVVEEVMFEVESFEHADPQPRAETPPAPPAEPAPAAVEPHAGLSDAERAAFQEIAQALGGQPKPAVEPQPLRLVASAGWAEGARILDALPVGVLVHRGDAPLFANAALLRLAGFDALDALRAEGGLPRLFKARAAGARDQDEGAPTVLATRRNETLPVEVRLATVDWEGGPAGVMLVRRLPDGDPAQRMRALELDLRSREGRLRELASILDTATDGVIVLDDAGRILSLNRSAEALFGYDQNEVAGDGLAVLLAPESHVVALDYLDGLKANGVASLLNDGREVMGRVRQGGAIPLFMTMGRVSEGPDRKFCAVLRDITSFKKAEAELLQAKRAAEDASAQKSDFLAKVSHEVRTPLNAIIGFAEVMLEERFGPVGNERYRDYLRDIHSSGGHVISLVNDLLDLAKIEAGRMELAFTGVSLNELVQSCVTLMQPQAARDRIVVRTSFAPKLPPVVADERSIRQIALNLVSNAIKFTDAGGQVIVSTALTDRGEVAFRVRDTGIGMSAGEVEAALEPFRQLATARKSDGTGLGLPLTKALIEANRGSLHITSAKDEGTLVEVLFPPTRVLAE